MMLTHTWESVKQRWNTPGNCQKWIRVAPKAETVQAGQIEQQ
jgi:hypothetical protein